MNVISGRNFKQQTGRERVDDAGHSTFAHVGRLQVDSTHGAVLRSSWLLGKPEERVRILRKDAEPTKRPARSVLVQLLQRPIADGLRFHPYLFVRRLHGQHELCVQIACRWRSRCHCLLSSVGAALGHPLQAALIRTPRWPALLPFDCSARSSHGFLLSSLLLPLLLPFSLIANQPIAHLLCRPIVRVRKAFEHVDVVDLRLVECGKQLGAWSVVSIVADAEKAEHSIERERSAFLFSVA